MTSTMNSQTTIAGASPNGTPSSAPYSRTGHPSSDDQATIAGSGTTFPHGHRSADAQSGPAVGDTNLPETSSGAIPREEPSPAPNFLPSHTATDGQGLGAGQDTNSQATNQVSEPNHAPSSASYLPGASDASCPIRLAPPASDHPPRPWWTR